MDEARLAFLNGSGPVWVVADEQTGGRGRHGRQWTSPPGNLYATLALADPVSIRYEQRKKVGQDEINGIKFQSLAWLQELGRKVAELRVTTTVKAIEAVRAAQRRLPGPP